MKKITLLISLLVMSIFATSQTHIISGTVYDENQTGLQGVTLSDGSGNNVTSDTDGYYEFVVADGWSGTITPSFSGYTFVPPSLPFTNVTTDFANQNFYGSPILITISGTISSTSGPLSGVLVSFTGGYSDETNSQGQYSVNVSYGYSGTGTPSKTGYTFNPQYTSYNTLTTSTTTNYTGIINTLTISGTIIDQDQNPLQGVTIDFSNGGGSATTNSSGFYTNSVNYGYTGLGTPTLAGYSFDPVFIEYYNITVNQTGKNYEGNLGGVTISGTITDGSNPISGVVITFSGGFGTAETNSNGYYSKSVDYGYSGTATPSKSGYTFTPVSSTYTNVTSSQTSNYSGAINTLSISGTIVDQDQNLLQGVTIDFSNGGGSTTTNASGQYTINVDYGYTGSGTPTLAGYSFNPVFIEYYNITVNQSGMNYEGNLGGVTISGTITDGSNPISGVVITFSGGFGTAETNSMGYYSKTVDYGYSGTATPSKSGYTFTPVSSTYTNVTTSQTSNYTGAINSLSISGNITDQDGSPMQGVTIDFSNGGGSTTTNASGNYTINVDYGYSGSGTPTKAGYSFDPVFIEYYNITVNQSGMNYEGNLGGVTISGTITDGSNPISGVVITFSGGFGTAETNSIGYYSKTVDYGYSGTATPAKSGYTFTPVSSTYTNVTTSQTSNYTGAINSLSISGNITDQDGSPMQGVTIDFSNGGGSTTTNASGNYTINVDYGYTGSGTPTLAGYSFDPVFIEYYNITVNQSGMNYEGNLGGVTISGTITDGSNPISGVVITFSGGFGTAETNSIGYYSKTVDYGYSGTATPAKSGYTFTPVSSTYTNVTTSQTSNYTGAINSLSISGNITDQDGSPMQGVTIDFSNGGGSTTTNASGNYTINVDYGYTGSGTPTLAGYSFDPVFIEYYNITVNQSGMNYEGNLGGVTISGTITDGSNPISGVVITFSGGFGTAETNSIGYYSKTVDYGYSGTATPSKSGYTFTPVSSTYTNVTTSQTSNYTGAINSLSISGNITDQDGSPMQGVTIDFSNGGGSTTTNASGNYTINVDYGYSGSGTPSKAGYSFDPVFIEYYNITVNQSGMNYEGNLGGVTISGTITNGSNPVQGVIITFSGGVGSAETNSNGYYSKSLNYGYSGTAIPSKDGYTFLPSSANYINVTTNMISDYTGSLNHLNISGTIVDQDNIPMEGVTINFSNSGGVTTSNASGAYIITVDYGYTGIGTPSKSGYTFEPSFIEYSSITINQTNKNYEGNLGGVTISGVITDGSNPIQGVIVSFSGGIGTAETNSQGFYSKSIDYGYSGTASPSKNGYTFSPVSTSYSNVTSNQTSNYTGEINSLVISGSIADQDGNPMQGVSISFSNNGGVTQSDVNGNYTINVDYGYLGIGTPLLSGYSFEPAFIEYYNITEDQLNQDYEGNVGGVSISGTITDGSIPIQGVILAFSGGFGTAETNSYGFYSKSVDYNYSGTTTPSKPGYSFNPTNISFTNVISNSTDNDFIGTGSFLTLSGSITNSQGEPIPDAEVVLSNIGNCYSDSDGYYAINVYYGWTGTITPNKDLFDFTPQYINISSPVIADLTGQDFTGSSAEGLTLSFPIYTFDVCTGDSIQSDPVITGGLISAYAYNWTSNPVSFTSSDRNPYLNTIFESTYYILEVTDGVSTLKDSVLVNSRGFPTPKQISGPGEVCRNQAGAMYTVTDLDMDQHYSWALPAGGSWAEGTDPATNMVVVNWANTAGPFDLTLATYNIYGCRSEFSESIIISSSEAPPVTPIIPKSAASTILIAVDEQADVYSWGYTERSTGQETTLKEGADRYCQMPHLDTDLYYYWVDTWYEGNTCSSRSWYKTPVWMTENPSRDLLLYPNPANELITIELPTVMDGHIMLRVISINGLTLIDYETAISPDEHLLQLNVSNLPDGLYLITITDGAVSYRAKMIKQ